VKGKSILIKSKVSDGEMGFVSWISHRESKRLYEKCGSSQFRCLAKWFNAVFNDNSTKFQRFANVIKVGLRNAASEIYSEFIYLCWRLWNQCFSVYILLNENYITWETKFIYRVTHACIEGKVEFSDRKKHFPCFLKTQLEQQFSPANLVRRTVRSTVNFLNLMLSVTGKVS